MEIQRETLVAPNSYTRLAPQGVGGEGGPGNYWVPVRSIQPHHFFLSSDHFLFPCPVFRCIDRHRTTNRFSSCGSLTLEAGSLSEMRRPHISLTTGLTYPLRIGLRKRLLRWSNIGGRRVPEAHLPSCISLRKYPSNEISLADCLMYLRYRVRTAQVTLNSTVSPGLNGRDFQWAITRGSLTRCFRGRYG